MSDAGATDRRLSDRLAHVQEALRSLLARTTDQAVLEGIEAAALELGLIRLGLDAPSPRSRRAHIRVKETIGTELRRGDRRIDAAIVAIPVGRVGLTPTAKLHPGRVLRREVLPVGWDAP